MTKKQILRSIAFFLAVAVMVIALCDVFELENTTNLNKRFYTYRSLKKDTVDAIILGTSGIDRFWIPSQAYEEYGMTVYPLATDAMPSWLYVPIIKDALSYHDLKLVVVDIRSFGQKNEDIGTMDVRARRVLDAMSTFSVHRIEAALKTMKIRDRVDSSASELDLSYIFSLIKYHGKWMDDDFKIEKNLGPKPHKYLGFFVSDRLTISKTTLNLKGYDPNHYEDLDPLCVESLYELIDFAKEEDFQLLFIDTPQIRGKFETGRSNTVYRILEEEGMDYIHYYTPDTQSGIDSKLNFDFDNDFYNTGHVNYYGAVKFTNELSRYFMDNYNLPDHRNDESVKKDWDGVQKKLLGKIAKLEEIQSQSK